MVYSKVNPPKRIHLQLMQILITEAARIRCKSQSSSRAATAARERACHLSSTLNLFDWFGLQPKWLQTAMARERAVFAPMLSTSPCRREPCYGADVTNVRIDVPVPFAK